jgi:hypothetical protein
MRAEKEIPSDYIDENKSFWKKAKRGVLSRPHELVIPANFLHNRITKTFDIDAEVKQPIMVWSTVFDHPKTPNSEFVYAERYPEEIAEEDKPDFHRGIVRITEYATNYATREFLRRNATPLADLYGAVADQATYGFLYNGTFRRMKAVELVAEDNGKDYKGALLTGLFQHDFGPINELVADTKEYSGWSDINDLAIEISRDRFKKPDIGKILDKVEIERTDGKKTSIFKNCAVSVLAGGVFRVPGVIEVSAGIIPVAFAETALIYLANQRMDGALLAHNLATITLPLLSVTPFATIHELIHYYSANKEFMGFIPANLINKEVTPHFSRLEPEEKI